jgi:N4-acetylcytidine amidohydrolase
MSSIIFDPGHIQMILAKKKTQTRRINPWYRVGKTYSIKQVMREPVAGFGIKITDIHQENLGDMKPEDAKDEGYKSLEEYKATWMAMFGKWQPDLKVFVISFVLVPNGTEQSTFLPDRCIRKRGLSVQ